MKKESGSRESKLRLVPHSRPEPSDHDSPSPDREEAQQRSPSASTGHGQDAAVSWLLRGEIDGQERRFHLQLGINRLGSHPDNDVAVVARGVSRQHALLQLRPEGPQVQDLDSTNGTYVNGERVQLRSLLPGDRLRLGAVELELLPVRADDGELVLSFAAQQATRGSRAGSTASLTRDPGPGLSGLWQRAVEGFVQRLHGEVWVDPGGGPTDAPFQPGHAALGRALALLADELGAEGVCVAELGASPIVLAGSGRLQRPGLAEGLPQLPERGRVRIQYQPAEGPWALPRLLAIAPGKPARGLLLWGEIPGWKESRPLLRTLLRLSLAAVDPGASTADNGQHGEGSEAAEPRAEDRGLDTLGLRFPKHYIPGRSEAMLSLYRQLASVAGTRLPVLLTGETGVGKERIAELLHLNSGRQGPFVPVHCAAIPEDLLESELFGIARGVATGVLERKGTFERAQGGTLFLDEIGDLPLELQVKLLRVLEDGLVTPLGGGEPVALDFRLVAATNARLETGLDRGTFRRDLFYRLAGCVLSIPPLRQRREDLPDLVLGLLRRAVEESGQPVRGLTAGALEHLVERYWRGNVRELAHELRRLVYVCPPGQAVDLQLVEEARELEEPATIELDSAAANSAAVSNDTNLSGPAQGGRTAAGPTDSVAQSASSAIEGAITTPSVEAARAPASGELDLASVEDLTLRQIEARVVLEALQRAGGNRSQAARDLGISRTALRRRLARLEQSDKQGS